MAVGGPDGKDQTWAQGYVLVCHRSKGLLAPAVGRTHHRDMTNTELAATELMELYRLAGQLESKVSRMTGAHRERNARLLARVEAEIASRY